MFKDCPDPDEGCYWDHCGECLECRPHDPLADSESYCWKDCPDQGYDKVPVCFDYFCMKVETRYELLHSNYDVEYTFGFGEHQGLGIRSRVKQYDPRFNDQVCWKTDCDQQGDCMLAYMWNHGRTVNTTPGLFRVEDTVVFTDTMYDKTYTYDEEYSNVAECIYNAGTDGFCDRKCGNDGYTLPDRCHDGPGHQADGDERQLYTAKSLKSEFPRWWDELDNGTDWWACEGNCACPKYGHNSNNDADAERGFFSMCQSAFVEDKVYDSLMATIYQSTCSSHCDGPQAWSKENNIANGTVDWCDGCMNLDEHLKGDMPGGQPCAGHWDPDTSAWLAQNVWGPFCKTVEGM